MVVVAGLLLAGAPTLASAAPTVSGRVWVDADRDGLRDAGELPRAGVRVVLQRNGRAAGTRRTSSTGRWVFPLRRSGTYRVVLSVPTGLAGFAPRDQGRSDRLDSDVDGAGASAPFRVTRASRPRTIDAGLLLPATPVAPLSSPEVPSTPGVATAPPPPAAATPEPSVAPTPSPTPPVMIGDRVWQDTDADGRQDVGELGLAGVTVELWDGIAAAKLATATSDASGAFSLAVQAGTKVRLRALLPSGATFSPALVGSGTGDSDIAPAGGETGFSAAFVAASDDATRDVGMHFPGTAQLGNFVFHDVDGEGDQDAGEVGIAGVTVELWNENRTQLLASTVTSAVGAYALQAPRGATYIVHFGEVPGMVRTLDTDASATDDSDPKDTGANAGDTSPIFIGPATASDSTIDAGYFRPVNLGNLVWDDVDADGVQDAGEPGLAGVTVQLWNSARTKLLRSTTSSATGSYTLVGSQGGSFRVRALLADFPGAGFSPKGTDPGSGSDSNVYPSGGLTGFTDPIEPSPSVIGIFNIDIGVDLP